MPLQAVKDTAIKRRCNICNVVDEIPISALERGVGAGSMWQKNACRLTACTNCTSSEIIYISFAAMPPSGLNRQTGAKNWLLRKLVALGQVNAAVAADLVGEVDPPQMLPAPGSSWVTI